MKLRLLLLVFLVSGFAFAQTTVTLQDQCNCEVLSGTAVNAAGAINPSGADTGDIYVNTNTGTIYFWDGNSWELTATDDQQLQNFNFNGATNTLTLDIEDGNSVSVDLSSLSNSGTDDQALTLVGNILTLEDGGTVNLAPYLDNTDDQTITAFSIDAANILTITLESGNTRTVDLSTLIGTDDQTAAEVNYDNTTSLLTATNVQDAIDEINAAAGTVALVDNGDGTYDFTDAAGTTTTITDTSISTLVDNANGTYTYTDETGATQTIDTNASANPYDNTTSGLAALNVQDAIDELSVGSSDDQNLTGATLDGANQLQIDIEDGSSATVDLSSLAETVIAGTGAITVTDDGNGNYTVNSTDPDEDLTNELTLIGAGVPAVIPSNSGVTYVDSVAGQLYIYDGATWIAVGGSSSPDLDGDPTNEQNTGFAVNGGNLEITDSGGTLGVALSSLGTDDQNIESLGLAGNILTVGIEDGTSQTVDLSALNDSGTDDQNLTGATLTGNSLQIDIENGSSTTVDLSTLVGTDDQILSTSGAAGNIQIENGNTLNLNVDDADASITNEVNTAFAVNAGNLEITDSNSTLSVPLTSLGTDDQLASEVNSDAPVDVDGDGNTEATVEDVIQDIAPITAKAARIFYPPSIAVDASTNGSFNVDLYAQYIAQFGTPTVASTGAPAAVPTYAATDLYYYVTYADPTVFNTNPGAMTINASGVLSYEIIGQPADYNSLINVVFVVK
ncbi:MAG: hypothetical protein WBN63_00755 [Eudoraea sp.]|uniref:beta strand repeat-containing protein n=2 Tax=Eudoraea sp. TaxID=1979955 RepID=UPI003C734D2B